MAKPPILERTQAYTFSEYFELTADPDEIFAKLDFSLQNHALYLPLATIGLDFVPLFEAK